MRKRKVTRFGHILPCYARETSTQLTMPSALRQAVHAMLDGLTTR
jgi:hypothetical protein